MSSHVFRGPTPIMEKSCRPFFRLATALLETAAGMGGILGSPAASSRNADSASSRKTETFLIIEILRLRERAGQSSGQNLIREGGLKTMFCGDTRDRLRRRLLPVLALHGGPEWFEGSPRRPCRRRP